MFSIFVILFFYSLAVNCCNEAFDSRFFVLDDDKEQLLANKFLIPSIWWSRPYEYKWASKFAKEDHIVLDAACGVIHPYVYFLAEKCKEVYACDIDNTILDKGIMLKNIVKTCSLDTKMRKHIASLYRKINFSCESISQLSYKNKSFDVIYCISVLEHLIFGDITKVLREFKRILKDNGLIILTFDVPSIDLFVFFKNLEIVGLKEFGKLDLLRPRNAIYSNFYDLYCFRAVLCKT